MMNSLIYAMQDAGLSESDPVLDGKIHRCRVSDKNKKNGWYIGVILSEHIYCTFGRWDTGIKIKWNNNGSSISASDTAELKRIAENLKKEKIRRAEIAEKTANKLYNKAIPDNHAYLSKKKINRHNSRVYDKILLIPIYRNGRIVNLQRIYPDGTKKYLYGGEIIGCANLIQGTEKICICEGFATGASIHEATGYTVIAAFQANNLEKIAGLAKIKYPDSEILICADNDKSGTGQKYAENAAELIQAKIVMPDIVGYDFNDLFQNSGVDAVRDIIIGQPAYTVAKEDISENDNISLQLPAEIINTAGLISDGLEAAKLAGAPDIIQYNFPVVISMIARAIAAKLCCEKVYPVMYNVKVGGTSTGKTDVDRIFRQAICSNGIEKFYGCNDFSSGPGLLRAMQDSPQLFVVLDEITYLFKRVQNDIVASGKLGMLLELYTIAGTEKEKSYADKGNNVKISNPCLILTGNATMNIFDDLKLEDLITGTLQRFDFWCYDGNIPYRNLTNQDNPAMVKFISGIAKIMASIPPQKNRHDLSAIIGNYQLQLSNRCQKRLLEYSHEIIDLANENKGEDGLQGIISRRYNLAIKYAMIHLASVRPPAKLYDPMDLSDLEWGIRLAEILADWKINILTKKLTAGVFHQDCEIFKSAIKTAIKSKLKPSLKILCNRKKRLNELKPKDLDDIIKTLISRGEILVDDSGRKPLYYLTK